MRRARATRSAARACRVPAAPVSLSRRRRRSGSPPTSASSRILIGYAPRPLLMRLFSLAAATLVTWRLNRALTFDRSGRRQGEEAMRYATVTAVAQGTSYAVFAALVLTVLGCAAAGRAAARRRWPARSSPTTATACSPSRRGCRDEHARRRLRHRRRPGRASPPPIA